MVEPGRVLVAHNRYQRAGGEDVVFLSEISLLRDNGHVVTAYSDDNERITSMRPVAVAMDAVWSVSSKRRISEVLSRERPRLAHFHNTFPLISPSAYAACAEAGVPVVQTVHNYRLACPASNLFREGRVCEQCLGRSVAWPGVLHACYRRSRAQTAVVTAMTSIHRLAGTWRRKVDAWIALTDFARRKLVEAGLPEDRIFVKPNFVQNDPGAGDGPGDYALCIGRLVPEKGAATMIRAWEKLGSIRLKVVGEGPLLETLRDRAKARGLSSVEFLGHRPHEEVLQLIRGARVLVFPSEWYEGFPMAIAESFAAGLPVIASRLGAMEEIIEHGRTGLHFIPGDSDDLAAAVERVWQYPHETASMRREARSEYLARYSAKRNYETLIRIYNVALSREDSPR